MDQRLTPANGRVAHLSLLGSVVAARFVTGDWARVSVALTDLLSEPSGSRERQLLYGERFLVLERLGGWAFGQAERDGYVGYLAQAALGDDRAATHWVSAPATHLYRYPDIKRPEATALSLGARITVAGAAPGPFVKTDQGLFALGQHLRPLGEWASDPVAVALQFLGTPYLWGGNSRAGLDCSGLVQAAHLACGIACPGDSDLQQAALGQPVRPGTQPERGDLLFWAGHVALVTGPGQIIHANGHRMAVTYEGIADATARIAAGGGGPVIGHKRLAG